MSSSAIKLTSTEVENILNDHGDNKATLIKYILQNHISFKPSCDGLKCHVSWCDECDALVISSDYYGPPIKCCICEMQWCGWCVNARDDVTLIQCINGCTDEYGIYLWMCKLCADTHHICPECFGQ